MKSIVELALLPHELYAKELYISHFAAHLGVNENDITGINFIKRSLDARGRQPKYRVSAEVVVNEPFEPKTIVKRDYPKVAAGKPIHIIGAGPAGLFAALRCIELGAKPILFERGKNVRDRRRDLAALNRMHVVNPESNYCFGEGGAGTYSDGKLYTRSKKRGDVDRILSILAEHGANPDILVNTHPHIGTNKLPHIIEAIRHTILEAGGEIHFNHKLTGIKHGLGKVTSIAINDTWIEVEQLILATGHSARDVFELLHQEGIAIEAKSFALGVRVEHPQQHIDSIQYHCDSRGEYLPPASYSVVAQVDGIGCYSFCMCPGGIIAPCATSPGEVVTNGWSPSKRNNPFANSGVVVEVNPLRLEKLGFTGPLGALRFQQHVEKATCNAGGGTQVAPAQRLTDFVKKRTSHNLPDCSYQPGITSVGLDAVLPGFVFNTLRAGFKAFDAKMRGYIMEEAVAVATESRTSSPVKIPRDREKLHHIQLTNLFPCAEGAGYAGGIVSAAIDGERCAEMAISL